MGPIDGRFSVFDICSNSFRVLRVFSFVYLAIIIVSEELSMPYLKDTIS
jgi:hypothetical protein